MHKADDPAFSITEDQAGIDYYRGLTKREYFAAMAMQGLLASGDWGPDEEGLRYMKDKAVAAADALIRALERKPE